MSSRHVTDFDAFFRAESDALLRTCWGLTVDRESARDLAQEVMARAWRNWETVGGSEAPDDSNPAAWCRTVALNLARGRWRRERVAAKHRPSPAWTTAAEPTDPDLVDALRGLAQRQREAIVLHHLLDLSVAQCAAEMGVSEPTVKTHLQRGRAELAAALRDAAPEPERMEG